uniref:Uncharacterized protein n=1 Tax=Compsopogon caeruleus TaxID=31354 RepID=A0A7S1TI52_9RHOD
MTNISVFGPVLSQQTERGNELKCSEDLVFDFLLPCRSLNVINICTSETRSSRHFANLLNGRKGPPVQPSEASAHSAKWRDHPFKVHPRNPNHKFRLYFATNPPTIISSIV